jgi:hypothetical protein
MSTGIKAFRKIQLGKETTAGSAVAATAIWRGIGTIEENIETVFPNEDIGILGGVTRSYIPKTMATLALESTPATFEQLPYILECGIEKNVTVSTDTPGFKYSYAFPIQTTDIHETTDLQTFTVEGGDNNEAVEFAYGICTDFNLSGNAGEALMMSATLVGRQASTSTFTGSIAVPTIESVLFSKGKMYIDACAATSDIGKTQITNTLLQADLSVQTGWTPVFTADGNIYFSFIKQVAPEVVLKITFEYNTSALAEIAAWRLGTARQIRLQFDGTVNKYVRIDMAGKWEKFDKIGEKDGNDIVTGTFRARYDSTTTLFFEMIVGNTLSALP